MIRLDVISDPVCPWCYVGATYLLRALANRPAHPFAIRWRPFQLNADMPPEGVDRQEYLAAKFGGAERAAQVYARVAEAAKVAGLDIDFERIERAPNTLDAHRVLRWAGIEGVQTQAKMALFRAYFDRGEDIGEHAVLTDAAAKAGMDAADVARLLASDADRRAVRDEADAAQAMGVTGVPTFIVGGRYVVAGAQPATLWMRVVDELSADAGDSARVGRGT
jgi:predicted DsbA family dithiol-disulfide isomerase